MRLITGLHFIFLKILLILGYFFISFVTIFLHERAFAAQTELSTSPLPEQINFQRLLENKDIALGSISSFFQDSQGFMWFGCGAGLIRYDGYEFKSIEETLNPHNGTQNNIESEKRPIKNVNHIFEDSEHTLWLSTRTGLLRYNPRTELLTAVPDEPNALTLSTLNVFSSHQISSGELLVGTINGLYILDRHNLQYSIILPDKNKEDWLHDGSINNMFIDKSGMIWLATNEGVEKFEWATKKFTLYKPYPEHPEFIKGNKVTDIVEGKDGALWVGTEDGLVNFDPTSRKTTRYINNPSDPYSIDGSNIAKLLIDSQGALWVASDGGGIAIFERTEQFPQGRFINHKYQAGRPTSISSNQVRTVFEDTAGDIWVGNYPTGINYFNRASPAVITYSKDIYNPNSLSHSAILAVRENPKGNLWLGTDGGGLNFFDREKNQFTSYKHDKNNSKSIGGDAVLDVFLADDGKIWCGTWRGGISILDPATGKFEHMPFDTLRPKTTSVTTSNRLNNDTVWTIKEDREKNIWIGSHDGGLSKFDKKTGLYTHYLNIVADSTSISSGPVWSVLEDSKGNLWAGTTTGLNLLNKTTGTFTHFYPDAKNPQSLSNASALTIFEDSKKRIWIGTSAGLNLLNPDGKTFTVYGKSLGFNDDSIETIVEGSNGELWLATNNGVSVLNPETKTVKNYNRDSGRLMGGFHGESGVLSYKNEIILGGIEGLRIFDPQKLVANKMIPPLAFTSLKVFADTVNVGDADGLLPQSLNYTNTIVLDYKKNMFQVGFAALNFRDSAKNTYAYTLEGFDKGWLNVGSQRTAAYTNLNPGTYVFRVRGSNNDGVWNNEGATITIIQLPPPWKTWWAYSSYFLLFLVALATFVRSQEKKVVYERMINQRLRNLDSLKEHFLANTSHELRTPLNGIIGLSESLCEKNSGLPSDVKQKLNMILISGQRLANIVNNIFDFSLLANNELTLSLTQIKLLPVIKRVVSELNDIADDKCLTISIEVSDNVYVRSSENRLSQILHHIIDNAIKFTRKGTINIVHRQDEEFDSISISDTGIGIAAEHLSTIFAAFQQVDGSTKRVVEGAGLGLSVIQKIVELHGGKINVESVYGKGTTFHIYLPREVIGTSVASTALIEQTDKAHENQSKKVAAVNEIVEETANKVEQKSKILIVDDDPVNRMVVKAHLRKQNYDISEAIDAISALKIIGNETDIDLIVLDVMMPHMTGYEACEILRKQYSKQKLPIIFLTANQQPGEAEKAMLVGGNDFLVKPISGKLLCDKIKDHLSEIIIEK